uniref:Uncharacterized protein n=1 Tax=Romanomermis culicivorax TaxID=13658 RepID=A0A915HGZ6_ROMCU
MSIKTGGTGQSKKRKGREEAEDSNSDLDLDMSCLMTGDFKCDKEKMLEFKYWTYKDSRENDEGLTTLVMAPSFLAKKPEMRAKWRVVLNSRTYIMEYPPA